MPRRGTNRLIDIIEGIALVDISTPSWPNAITVIDEADIDIVIDGNGRWLPFKTPLSNTPYVVRKYGPANARRQHWLHRFILGLPALRQDGRCVDHIDGDGLNNARINPTRWHSIRQHA